MAVALHYREGRSKPFEARWYVNGSTAGGVAKSVPRSRFFSTDKDRAKFVAKFTKEVRAHGTTSLKANPARMKRWQAADHLIGAADPVEVASFWVTHRGRVRRVTLEGIKAEYLAYAQAETSPDHYRHIKKAYGRICETFGRRMLAGIESIELQQWLEAFDVAPVTKKNWLAVLTACFEWAVRSGYAPSNPWKAVSRPRIITPEPGILTLEETRRLFEVNKDNPGLCARLALGTFGGMRASAVSRVEFKEIDYDRTGIITPALKTKKSRRQFIQGLPGNLWDWLTRAGRDDFATPAPSGAEALEHWKQQTLRSWLHQRNEGLKRAGLRDEALGVSPPRNWARHSFVSYHIAAYKNPPQTSYLISHRGSVKTLAENYLGVATEQDGREYFAIQP